MQLKKKTRIKGTLTSATCVLLGTQMAHGAENQDDKDHGWRIDTAVLSYSEADRVDANEVNVRAQKTFDDDSKLNLNFLIDTLTGATPNGAAPSDQTQTFTRPSGDGSYDIQAGETPLDDTFHDTRVQIGVAWEAPINRLMRYNIGTNISNEFDYQSISVNGGLSRDFNKKNTTLSLGGAFASDTLNPKGGIPITKASMAAATTPQPRDGASENKEVLDLVFGITQIINARTLMQFNLGISQSNGYLNDPYKIVSVVDINGRPVDYIYESRPDSRTKTSFYWDTKHHFNWEDTIDISYRYMTDDWGITSHTVDLRYRWNINDQWYTEPHLRYYQQSAADFYRHSVSVGEAVVTNDDGLSADVRLAEFDASTIGVKVAYKMTSDSELNMRLESYQQMGDTSPADAVGVQKNYDMFPNLDAIFLQVGYTFKF